MRKKFKADIANEIYGKIWQVDIERIDELNSNVGFVMAVLDAIGVMGCGDAGIKGSTLLHLASEAGEKMGKVREIIRAIEGVSP